MPHPSRPRQLRVWWGCRCHGIYLEKTGNRKGSGGGGDDLRIHAADLNGHVLGWFFRGQPGHLTGNTWRICLTLSGEEDLTYGPTRIGLLWSVPRGVLLEACAAPLTSFLLCDHAPRPRRPV